MIMNYYLGHLSKINYYVHWSTTTNNQKSMVNPTPQTTATKYYLISSLEKKK